MVNPDDPAPGGHTEAGPGSPWWQTWGLFVVVTALGWLPIPLLVTWGWVLLGGARGLFWGGTPPVTGLGTVLWAASALLLVGPGCLASLRLWPLRLRLAVAVPVGLAWFVLGRCVLPAPTVPGSIRSATEALASLLL